MYYVLQLFDYSYPLTLIRSCYLVYTYMSFVLFVQFLLVFCLAAIDVLYMFSPGGNWPIKQNNSIQQLKSTSGDICKWVCPTIVIFDFINGKHNY